MYGTHTLKKSFIQPDKVWKFSLPIFNTLKYFYIHKSSWNVIYPGSPPKKKQSDKECRTELSDLGWRKKCYIVGNLRFTYLPAPHSTPHGVEKSIIYYRTQETILKGEIYPKSWSKLSTTFWMLNVTRRNRLQYGTVYRYLPKQFLST